MKPFEKETSFWKGNTCLRRKQHLKPFEKEIPYKKETHFEKETLFEKETTFETFWKKDLFKHILKRKQHLKLLKKIKETHFEKETLFEKETSF